MQTSTLSSKIVDIVWNLYDLMKFYIFQRLQMIWIGFEIVIAEKRNNRYNDVCS